MDIRQAIHFDSHGSLAVEGLIPIEEAYKTPVIVKSLGLPENLSDSIKYLNVDPKYIFVNPKSMLDSIVYLKGYTLVNISSLNINSLKSLMVKERIEHMTARMEKFVDSGDWVNVFAFMEKKLLIPMFLASYREIPADKILNVFEALWTRSESGFHQVDPEVLDYVYSHKSHSEDHQERMEKLINTWGGKDSITVYRGSGEHIRDGYSWTTSLKTAKWFANRFGAKGSVYKGVVDISDIYDYFEGRGEFEVLINPKDVKRS